LKVALVLCVVTGGAPEPIEVSGAVVSTVQLWVAGDASVLFAASIARTRNWWPPCARFVYETGDWQAVNAAASSAHSNLEPCSSAEKVNVALVLLVSAAGAPEPIEVCGAVVSGGGWIVQL
jgi:hypothetical protein